MTDLLDRLVRAADPLDTDELAAWTSTATAPDTGSTDIAEAKRRRRLLAPPVMAGGAVVIVAAGAAAAATVLGQSAPPSVQQHLRELDRGMPADLRYDPDVEHARAVATTESGALYLADLADGGYCLEIVSDSTRPRGATCLTDSDMAVHPFEVAAPIPDNQSSPLLVGGRVTDDDVTAVEARYADGDTTRVPFGLDHAWLLEVPAGARASVLSDGVTLVGLGRDGDVVQQVHVPPLRDDDPRGTAHDNQQPIVVNTTSDGQDLTLVLAIRGRVNVDGARLVLRYPDGTTVTIPVAANGRYSYDVPAARQHDFARESGVLTAVVGGETAASTPVASVAYWRGHYVGDSG